MAPKIINIYLRKADAVDIPVMWAIQQYDTNWTLQSFANEMQLVYSNIYLLVEDQLGILGFIIFWRIENTIDILNIAITAKYRKQGLASFLLQYVIAWAHHHMCTCITLDVNATNQAALALYTKFDFKVIGCRRGYYRSGNEQHDAWVMQLDLITNKAADLQ